VCVVIGASSGDVKVDIQDYDLGEDVADLRFELGVESSTAEAELVMVVLCMLYSCICKIAGGFESRGVCKNKMHTHSQ
jgi:hypothetical protein